MSEGKFLAELRLYLGKRPDVMALRINTGVFRPMYGEQNRRIRSAPNGTADLLCLWLPPCQQFGRGVAIETKSARGDQLEAQLRFQKRWTACGGIYIVAKRLDHVTQVIGDA
jgi:hypothetical protein